MQNSQWTWLGVSHLEGYALTRALDCGDPTDCANYAYTMHSGDNLSSLHGWDADAQDKENHIVCGIPQGSRLD